MDYANRSVLSYHSYCANDAAGAPAPMGLCRTMIDRAWDGVRDDLKRVKTGGMLTEFGACGDDPASVELLRRQTEGADEQLQGWIYWRGATWIFRGRVAATPRGINSKAPRSSRGRRQHSNAAKIIASWKF